MLVYKNASFSSCISQKWPLWVKKLLLKKFFVALFFRVTPQATGAPGDCMKNGHINFFKYSRASPLRKVNFKQIQKKIRDGVWKSTRNATEVNKGPEVYICAYIHICVYMCMTGDFQFCTVFFVVKCLCFFWNVFFF